MLANFVNYGLLFIGLVILLGGLYYLFRECDDNTSRKIYGTTSILGAVILAAVMLDWV